MLGFWLVVVIVVLGLVIMAAELGVPRQAGRRADGVWRADYWEGLTPRQYRIQHRYFAQAPRWYRALTGWWSGWRWVRL